MEQRTPTFQYSSTPILQHSDVSVVLRVHHLLCLHGFRGFGYSPEFVSNMQLVRDGLASSPDVEVEVTTSPDDICSACPHLQEGKCARDGGDSETRTGKRTPPFSRGSLYLQGIKSPPASFSPSPPSGSAMA